MEREEHKNNLGFQEERHYREFFRECQQHYDDSIKMNPGSYDEKIKSLEKLETFLVPQDTLIFLIDFTKFNLLYVGGNTEKIWGYTKDEIHKMNAKIIFKMMTLRHADFPLRTIFWTLDTRKKINSPIKNERDYFCGVKLKHKKGHKIRSFFRLHVLEHDQKNNPTLILYYINDISHLMKDNFYWGRYTNGEENENVHFFTTQKGRKKTFPDVLSPRELEVLSFLEKGNNSREIAETLSISLNTVEKHRKNMLARPGTKDTTALIQICKMCELL